MKSGWEEEVSRGRKWGHQQASLMSWSTSGSEVPTSKRMGQVGHTERWKGRGKSPFLCCVVQHQPCYAFNKRRKRLKGKVIWIWIVTGNALHSFTHKFVLYILSLHWNPSQGLSYICNPTQLCTIWVRNDLEDSCFLSS